MIKVSCGCCGAEELEQVKEAFDYGYFGLAYKVNEFEDEMKKYLHTDRESIATANGTAALHLALDSIGLKRGDEVIVPAFTFVATVQAIRACGATPVFCDVIPHGFLMNIDDVKRKITKKTKAIIPVHYAGNPCDMDSLLKIKEDYGVRIVEDAAHAFGSEYQGKKIGSFGDITCFSFDSIKVLTCGEGGAVFTADSDVADLIRKKRLLGIDRKTMHTSDWKKRSWVYDVATQGYRYHMSNINAAIGLAQLKKIDSFISLRREITTVYNYNLKDLQDIILPDIDYSTISPFMYVIRVKNNKRNELKEFLMSRDIETGISYIPCNHFSICNAKINLPVTEEIYEEILCLPIHCKLHLEDIKIVTDAIHEFFAMR
jgi:dTDP-4-amino-4,6-dideoxygalactose transaminase